ncbi:MAG: diguanylate cyclase [Polaromonas sp.]|nr:diguanylate cyclase [Polaromonas sp.]
MTNLQKQVAKCIRYAASHLLGLAAALSAAGLMLLPCSAAWAQPVAVLSNAQPQFDVREASLTWIDTQGQVTIDEITSDNEKKTQSPMLRSVADSTYLLGEKAALWQHYRFARATGASPDWLLEFPLPLLDKVTVFQRAPSGGWVQETAGDTVAISTWPEAGRYPQFSLRLASTGVHDVYVRIQHATYVNLPVNVVLVKLQVQRRQWQHMMIGGVLGTLLLLVLACSAQIWVYRDKAYGWYATYASLMVLLVGAWTGVGSQFFWGEFPIWNNLAPGVLGILCGSAALLVVRNLCSIRVRHPWFEGIVYRTAWLGLPLSLLYAIADRTYSAAIVSFYLVIVVVLGMSKAVMSWWREDVAGFWIFASLAPLAIATLVTVTRVLGWISSSWMSQYSITVALSLQVPLLLVALNIRSRDRHGIESREQAMASQDALTGLLAAHIFDDRLKQVVSRTLRHREPAAVVFVELVNYPYIKKTWGIAVAEQSLLRSVIKLRRILHDVNTVGRIDESRFGLVLEGVDSRTPVIELSARLIAAGLMPLKGLKPEVILQFHVAAVLLTERLAPGPETSSNLKDLLGSMAARTRRPIRFLEQELTRPAPLDGHDSLEPSILDGPRIEDAENSSHPMRQVW